MKAFISWRRIGGWVIQLGEDDQGFPIRDLIDHRELQTALRQTWPTCAVELGRGFAEMIVREVPYEGAHNLITYLSTTYRVHPVNDDHITWGFGKVIG